MGSKPKEGRRMDRPKQQDKQNSFSSYKRTKNEVIYSKIFLNDNDISQNNFFFITFG